MKLASKLWHRSLALCLTLALGACAEVELASHVAKSTPSQGSFKVGNPYKVEGQWYNPTETYEMTQTGIASWYGPGFHGKKTANGEIYNMNELTAAHKTLQLPSLVRVTNLDNGKSVIVRVNDRGSVFAWPYHRSVL
jgi:rare lipoprotein A